MIRHWSDGGPVHTLTAAAILFDMDGVLLDSLPVVERTWRRWAERHDLSADDILTTAHGRRTRDTLRTVAPELATDQEVEWLDAAELEDFAGIRPIAGAHALVACLPSDRWTVVTSAGRELAARRLAKVGLTLPADAVSGGSTLWLDVDAKSGGNRDARLTYATSGLGWRAAYNAMLADGGSCRMQFKPEASIANRSGRDYDGARIKLVAGQPNLGNRPMTFQSMAMKGPAPMAAARPMPEQASLGDYRSFTLPGAVSLPSGTVTLAPLYPVQALDCQREYVVEDGGAYFPPKPNTNDYGAQDYQDRAITSTLAFSAPDALPAGTLRAWTVDRDGAPALLGQAGVADTPKGQRVSVQLGESFALRASRERTAFHVDVNAHTMTESYKITLTNGGDAARTVTVREHPNRWREWTVATSSIKPSKQTPQLLEFAVPVPAQGSATLTYTVKYTWTARDS